MKLSKQEMKLFHPLQGLWSKNFFTKYFSFSPRNLKLIFKTGNRIIKTGNGIILPTSAPLIQKKMSKYFTFSLKINFQNRKWNYPNRKGSNFSTSGPLIKTYFTRYFTFPPKEFRMDFQKRKSNYSNRKWNYFSNFQASDQKTSFTFHFFHLDQGVQNWFTKHEMESSK